MKNNRFGLLGKRALANLAVIVIGVLLYMALSNFEAVSNALAGFFAIFSPFASGIAIAYLLNMPMRFLENHLFKNTRHRRGLSILLTYLGAVLLLAFLLGMVLPQLVESLSNLLSNIPGYLTNLNDWVAALGDRFEIEHDSLDSFLLSYTDIVNQVVRWVRGILPDILGSAMKLGSGIVSGLTAIIASIYMLAGKEKLLRQCRRVLYAVLPKRWANDVMRLGALSNGVFSGFISGKLLDSVIIGVICFVFMALMNILSTLLGLPGMAMPYAPLISVLIGATNIIPFFGPFIGAIPAVMILLMVNPWSAIWFTVFIIVLQQFDGNILGPKILGQSTGLPAIWVLVAIIVGGGLFGFTGMLLGVPTTAVLYTLASDIIEKHLKKKGLENTSELARGATANKWAVTPPYIHEGEDTPPAGANAGAPPSENPPPQPSGEKEDTGEGG